MESGLTTHQLFEELGQQTVLHQLSLDYFCALVAYCAVPGQDKTAENGEWQPSSGQSLLNKLKEDGKGVL